MVHSLSHMIFYICRVRACLLFLRELCNIIFSRGVKAYTFSPSGTNFTGFINIGSERSGLTKFAWPFQKSRQNLSLPNF